MLKNYTFKDVQLIAIAAWLLQACAVIRAPDGGPPDESGPVILSFSPAQRTLHYTGTSIEVEFDEYVDRSSVAKNIFISPPIATELEWSGKKLEIVFAEPLLPNTSYAATLGTEYTDLHNNKPSQAFTLIFSTGSVIDSGIVRGQILSPNPEGVFLFLYPLSGINPDTLQPSHTKPKYRTQAGSNGKFEFAALADGDYRLIAVRDEFNNSLYNAGSDGFGTPWDSVRIKAGKPCAVNLLVGPPRDTTGPLLYNARMINSRMIETTYSKNIDTLSVSTNAFRAADSASGKQITVDYAFFGKNTKIVNVVLNKDVENYHKILFTALSDSVVALRDLNGNILGDTLNSRYLTVSQRKDSMLVKIAGISLRDSSLNMDLAPVFNIKFSAPAKFENCTSLLVDNASNKPLPIETQTIQGVALQLQPKERLTSNQWYTLNVKIERAIGWNGVNLHDTLLTLRFKTLDLRQMGTVQGSFRDSINNAKHNLKYKLTLISEDGRRQYVKILNNSNANFEFAEIPEGKYYFEAYQIGTENKHRLNYYYGSVFPFQSSWRFYRTSTFFSVRSRWTVDDVIIHFGAPQ